MRKNYTDEQAIHAIKNNLSYAKILKALGLKSRAGGNYNTIRAIIRKYKVDTSHFTGQGWAKDGTTWNARNLESLLIIGTCPNQSFKKRLIKEGILKEICYECGSGPIWRGKKLVLELEHENGNKLDNRRENLKLLCPNCHSQTPTFRRRKAK